MSLDVYLTIDETLTKKPSSGIYVRNNGMTTEISEKEWYARHPDREPVRVVINEETDTETNEAFSANITHNLNKMADEAGIYEHLWRPDELKITKAKELIKPLTEGLKDMKERPEHYKKFSAENKWGTYEQFIPWIEDYLNACIEYPDANVNVCR